MERFQWTCRVAFWFLDHPLSHVLNENPAVVSADTENNSVFFFHDQSNTGKATRGGAQGCCSLPKHNPMGGNCVISTQHRTQCTSGARRGRQGYKKPQDLTLPSPRRHTHTHTTCSSYYLMSIPKSHLADPPSSLCAKPIHTGVIIVDRNQFGLAEKEASQGKKKSFRGPPKNAKAGLCLRAELGLLSPLPQKKLVNVMLFGLYFFSPLH